MESALRQYRAENGLTLNDLATRTGIGESHLSRLERRKAGISLPNAIKLAEVTGLPVDAFVGGQVKAA